MTGTALLALSDRTFFGWAVILYGISALYSIFVFRQGFRRDNRIQYLVILAGYLLHTTAMLSRGISLKQCPITNLYEASSFLTWAMVTAYLISGISARVRFLGAFISPLLFAVGIFTLMPSLDVQGDQPKFVNFWASLHAALILLSYGAFGLAAVAGSMYLVQERDLKLHRLRAVLSLMPSIQRLERVTEGMVVCGFVFLTSGLLLAPFLVRQAVGHEGTESIWSDPKLIWSLVVWGSYLVLLVMRWVKNQRGRPMALWSLGGFGFILLTYWGTNLLSKVHN